MCNKTVKILAKREFEVWVYQTNGTPKTTKYNFYYKKDTSNWNLLKNDDYTVMNCIYQGEYSGHASKGTSKYSYKLIRDKNPSGKTLKMNLELRIQ